MILHLVPKAEWEAVPAGKPYLPAAYAKDGFIHCTDDARTLLKIANQFYKGVPGDVLLLTIDETALTSPVKWEAPVHPGPVDKEKGRQGEGEKALPPEVAVEAGVVVPTEVKSAEATEPQVTQFPHIYGPLNREAIVSIRKFLRGADGAYTGFDKENLLPAMSVAAPSIPAQTPAAKQDPLNPLNIKTPSQMADELLDATDGFSEALNRFKDRVEGRIERLDDEIKKKL